MIYGSFRGIRRASGFAMSSVLASDAASGFGGSDTDSANSAFRANVLKLVVMKGEQTS